MTVSILDLGRNLSNLPTGNGSVYFIGTATTIIKLAGFTILTDPNFLHAGDHIHIGYGLHATRLTDPAIDIEDLPAIDACILSHMHADHFDRIAMEKLDKRLPIITTRGAVKKLAKHGFENLHALRKWDSIILRHDDFWLKITAMPGKHGPGAMNAMLPTVMGSMLEWGQTGSLEPLFRLYISGDTLVHNELKDIPKHYPQVNLALIHLGGTRVLGILVTMDANQGLELLRIVRPEEAIPIHYNDYNIFKSPLEEFVTAVAGANDLKTRVHYLNHGDVYAFTVEALQRKAA